MSTIDNTRLSPQERLEPLEQLWDSLSALPDGLPLTEARREQLDRRPDDLDREGPSGIPRDEVMRRVP